MEQLSEYLSQARTEGRAVGHFNFSTADVLRAIVEGARSAGATSVMVGTSEGEAGFIGFAEAVALVKTMREEFDFPIFLNADHFKSFELCKEAIDAGYDSVLIDGSRLPLADNIELTQRVVHYARSISKKLSIEGELGYLRGSSEVQEKVEIGPEDYTKPEEAAEFVRETGVDRLAVVFGNIHGIVTEQEEKLDIAHLEKIAKAIPETFLILHGASGLSDADISSAIKAGIVNVHFNTELRIAYTEAIEEAMHPTPGGEHETAPHKYLAPAAEEVKKIVIEKTKLFVR
ncbi:MAG: class II fructose-bisphosphate aldolase [Patescibacteria group bacterium]